MRQKRMMLSMLLACVLWAASTVQATMTTWDFEDGLQGWSNYGNGDGPTTAGHLITSVCYGGSIAMGADTSWQVKSGDTLQFEHYEGLASAYSGPRVTLQINGDATNYVYDFNQRSTSWATLSANLADFSNGSRNLTAGDVVCLVKIDVSTASLDSLNLDNVQFVPEPATMLLLSSGAVCLWSRARRKR